MQKSISISFSTQTGIADMNAALMSSALNDARLDELRDQADRFRAAIQQMELLVS